MDGRNPQKEEDVLISNPHEPSGIELTLSADYPDVHK
jgi:hypothetical protein